MMHNSNNIFILFKTFFWIYIYSVFLLFYFIICFFCYNLCIFFILDNYYNFTIYNSIVRAIMYLFKDIYVRSYSTYNNRYILCHSVIEELFEINNTNSYYDYNAALCYSII